MLVQIAPMIQHPATHELKTDSIPFQAVKQGRKKFEIRLNDRNFQIGDRLILRETKYCGEAMAENPEEYPLEYTGETVEVIVSHLMNGPVYGLLPNWVIMSILPAKEEAAMPKHLVAGHVIHYPQYQKRTVLPLLDVLTDSGRAYGAVILDTYDVNRAFEVHNPAQAHAVKKILRAGKDHNDYATDLKECKDSLDRAIEVERLLSRLPTPSSI